MGRSERERVRVRERKGTNEGRIEPTNALPSLDWIGLGLGLDWTNEWYSRY